MIAPTSDELAKFQPGDVFQIGPEEGRKGWIGAFVYATEIRSWGILGFVAVPENHNDQGRAYIRLKWEEVDYIGRSRLTLEERG